MLDNAQVAKARQLRSLHDGPVLVLPNAWDAASAAVIAAAGGAGDRDDQRRRRLGVGPAGR